MPSQCLHNRIESTFLKKGKGGLSDLRTQALGSGAGALTTRRGRSQLQANLLTVSKRSTQLKEKHPTPREAHNSTRSTQLQEKIPTQGKILDSLQEKHPTPQEAPHRLQRKHPRSGEAPSSTEASSSIDAPNSKRGTQLPEDRPTTAERSSRPSPFKYMLISRSAV